MFAAAAPTQAGPMPEGPYRLSPWQADYPIELRLPSPNPAPVYQRSSGQALERVVANLQGNTGRDVWLMATEFFGRAPEEAIEPLIVQMDRCFSQPMLIDVVRNVIEAMGRMGREEFDDALRRALEHPDVGVRQAAFTALATSGKPETIRAAGSQFLGGMDGRARVAWLRAVRLRLPEEAPAIYRQLMRPDAPPAVRDLLIDEVLKLPAAQGADVIEGVWDQAVGPFKATCAGVLHEAGVSSGTLWLHNALTGDDPLIVVKTLESLQGRELGLLREDVLALSTHARPEVRLQVAKLLAGRAGDDVTNTYEVLAGTDELVETKSIALRELTLRDRPAAVSAVIESAATATGTRLQLLLRLLGNSGDPRCVEIFRSRFAEAPGEEGRPFLVALALCQAPGSARALFDLFVADPRTVSKPDSAGRQLDTMHYIPVLLPNLRGQERELLSMWPKAKGLDLARRALFLNALSGIAVERGDAEILREVGGLLRNVLMDPAEAPQLRIQALNALSRSWIDMDDVRRLRRMQEVQAEGEAAGMRALVKDYLFQHF